LADPALQQVQGSERSRTARGGKIQTKEDLIRSPAKSGIRMNPFPRPSGLSLQGRRPKAWSGRVCKDFMLSIRQRDAKSSHNSLFAISGEK
jgi:hypothetical protein